MGLPFSRCNWEADLIVDDSASDRLGRLLPRRLLGKTGEAVTMLGVGGWHLGRMPERDAQETIETALEGGVRFFDTAETYQEGGSEQRLGRLLNQKYRDVIFLMTKSVARDSDTARQHLEGSLRRLQVDCIDLWQIHGIDTPEIADRLLDQGVLDVFKEAQAEGKVRYIGFTGHHLPETHLRMLQRGDGYQTVQMPVNLADVSYKSFIKTVMPRLIRREIGILGMKSLANGGFFGGSQHGEHGKNPRVVPFKVSVREAIHFAWSLPISVLISGPDNPAQMREKILLAQSFTAMDERERQSLIDRVSDMAGRTVEFYKG
jgi:aryl-alcohol dehydrogenase-like predicted oxidoreductase